MLVPVTNVPRDYAWGSRTLLAALEGRPSADQPEAEVWLGDHPSDPADLADGSGRSLADWLAQGEGEGRRLPFLMKLLAAGSPLSIQVHPTKAQAEVGYAAERDAGVTVGNYVDDNHKPEIIVALSDRFEALCGIRDLDATDDLLQTLGEATVRLRAQLRSGGAERALEWLLAEASNDEIDSMISALETAESTTFAAELANARRVAAIYPGDAGVMVALLMNFVELRQGEAIFLGAGKLHAYVSGLGVEVMAASDNVLRGGLTPKRIDVPELLRIVDATPESVPVILPVGAAGATSGVGLFPVPVDDFALCRVRTSGVAETIELGNAPGMVVATAGTVSVASGNDSITLQPGQAVFVPPASGLLSFNGQGEAYLATSGEGATRRSVE